MTEENIKQHLEGLAESDECEWVAYHPGYYTQGPVSVKVEGHWFVVNGKARPIEKVYTPTEKAKIMTAIVYNCVRLGIIDEEGVDIDNWFTEFMDSFFEEFYDAE